MAKTPEVEVDPETQDQAGDLSALTSLPSSKAASVAPTSGLKLWVELKHLSPEEEQTYEKVLSVPDRIVGELKENGKHYVYALFDTIAYRYTIAQAKNMWLDKVDEYLTKKDTNELEDFDPTSPMVHPASRPKRTTIKIPPSENRRVLRARPPTLRKVISEDEGDDDDGDEGAFKPKSPARNFSDDEELDYNISDDDIPVRRSKREAAAKGKAKLRQGQLDFSGHGRQLRRSTRRVQSEDEDEEEEEEEETPAPKPQTVQRPKVHKPIPPGYGAIHYTEYDYDMDAQLAPGETSNCYLHREFCEACSQLSGYDQLTDLKSSKKKNTREAARIKALGGWVLCMKCCVASHWSCLSEKEQDDIKRSILAKEGSNRKNRRLDVGETTDYICNHCAKGSNCMFCQKLAVKKTTIPTPAKATSDPNPPAKANGDPNPPAKATGDLNTPTKVTDVPNTSTEAIGESKGTEVDKPTNTGDGEPLDATNESNSDAKSKQADNMDISVDTPIESTDNKDKEEEPLPEVKIKTERLVYRCNGCDRAAHYDCLVPPSNFDFPGDKKKIIDHYQERWRCIDCFSYSQMKVEYVLAWRPYPANARQPSENSIHYKDWLPREYLVKWDGRGFNRCDWVSHSYLLSKAAGMLRNFMEKGSRVPLLEKHISPVTNQTSAESSRAQSVFNDDDATSSVGGFELASDEVWQASFRADALAERRIPPAWKTTDRILDVKFWKPPKPPKKGKPSKHKTTVVQSSEDEVENMALDEDPDLIKARLDAEDEGIEPDEKFLEFYEDRKKRQGKITMEDVQSVAWAYIKWDELPYEQATWDSRPTGESGRKSFDAAFERYLMAKNVVQPKIDQKFIQARDIMLQKDEMLEFKETPNIGQDPKFKLFPFQLEGLSWLYGQWIRKQSVILADEMGLGKTVQMATFIGYIHKKWGATPSLVVVPKSTVINWLREFARWAPELVVAPYFGDKKSRELMKDYEVFHDNTQKNTIGIKFHVLVTTYETITQPGNMAAVFSKVPRWELLVVDEGQKLKNDHSLIFRKLNELKTAQRVIMTGTPLNNNIRELFNLMNFLDGDEWNNLDQLEKDHQELTEESVAVLHERLKPYFLRRLKIDVLDLPPKNEVIVPVSMTPLQKEVYRHVLSKSMDAIEALMRSKATGKKSNSKKSLNNTLMQLRKCLQHPYLINQDLEQHGLTPAETSRQLVDASAKLRLLRSMLPKLKARGHRILLFSQFKIALDIIDDFLVGEGYKFLRLDGDTPQDERQKGMDEFNKPNSDYFIYILTTRAGGVGINLSSADTVIIFDPDFNPHQDLQAIARSYRYGLQRTCLVFKLMVRDSAEEKIMQIAKNKLVLDHLIVQKMDEEDASEDLQSVLTYGAKVLFADNAQNDITYSDADLDKLIERTETEVPVKATDASSQQALKFDYAKLWVVDRNTLEDIKEGEDIINGDSWAAILAKAKDQAAKDLASENLGRGSRRRAAVQAAAQTRLIQGFMASPEKKAPKKTSKSDKSDDHQDVDFAASESGSSSEESEYAGEDLMDLDLPLFLPTPSEDSVSRGQARQSISTQTNETTRPFTKLHGPPLPLSLPPPVTSQPAFMFPQQPYPPFPLKYPNNDKSATAVSATAVSGKQITSMTKQMKRPSDTDETPKSDAPSKKVDGETRPHKKARKSESGPQAQVNQTQTQTKHQSNPALDKAKQVDIAIARQMSKSTSAPVLSCRVCQKPHEDGACLLEEKNQMIEYRTLILNEPGDETPEQQQEVLKLIDKKLRRIDSRYAELKRPLVKSTLSLGRPPTQSTSTLSINKPAPAMAIQLPSLPTNFIHSPLSSTHIASSAQASTSAKSTNVATSSDACPACNETWHPLKSCPLVTAGPDSVKQIIKKLKTDPEKSGVVSLLRSIRSKQLKKLGQGQN